MIFGRKFRWIFQLVEFIYLLMTWTMRQEKLRPTIK